MNMNNSLQSTPVKILVVDDAPLMRRVIQQIMAQNDDIEVVGTAANGQECLDKIPLLKPDVITLDIDMPVMNGITAIKNIMVRHQIPTVIVSSLVQDGYFAFEALRLGVVDFVPKPSRVASDSWGDEEELLRMRVRMAAGMQVNRMRRVRRRKLHESSAALPEIPPTALVALGTTLAGPNTIMHIVTQLPADFQGAVIGLQEIHPRILAPFCSSFREISPLEVVPVIRETPILNGRVYIGSTFGGVEIDPDPDRPGLFSLRPTEAHDAPIDTLFESAARYFGDRTCGVLLTGVGTDGAEGLSKIQEKGGLTIAQDQDCCVYPNLVENALQRGVVDVVMSNRGIADRLNTWIKDKADH